jgi:hypothetical protein
MFSVRTYLSLLLIVLFGAANAQDTTALDPDQLPEPKSKHWKLVGTGALQLNQVAFSNWSAGGNNTINLVSNVGLGANYNRGRSRWVNDLQFDYGLIKNNPDPIRKNLDVLNFSSNYSYRLHNNFRISAINTLLTQVAPGYNYTVDPEGKDYISNLFAPAYIQQGLGMEFVQDSVVFSVMVSPLAVKHTLILDRGVDPLDYGVLTGRSRHELGAFVKAQIRREIMKNIFFTSDVTFFSNYLDDPQNIDMIYQGKIDIIANKFITVSLSLNLIYDDDIELPVYEKIDGVEERVGSTKAGLQVRQAFGVGLSYKF